MALILRVEYGQWMGHRGFLAGKLENGFIWFAWLFGVLNRMGGLNLYSVGRRKLLWQSSV